MSKIKYKHSPGGEIRVNHGVTCFSDLLAIGAVIHTSNPIDSKDIAFNEYDTDQKGLQFICNKNDEIIEFLQDSIKCLSLLVVNDEHLISHEEDNQITCLLVALTELSDIISSENIQINNSLPMADKGDSNE